MTANRNIGYLPRGEDGFITTDETPLASTSNLTTVRLRPILERINLPTVIKPYPLAPNRDAILIATLAGQIWLHIGGRNADGTPYYKLGRPNRSRLYLDISGKIGQLGLSRNNQYDERGLIGLEFDPEFIRNGLFYLYYSSIERRTTAPPVRPVDPCIPTTLNQRWTDFNLYDHINILEEWQAHDLEETDCCRQPDYNCWCKKAYHFHPTYQRRLLAIKQPFHNHNGQNNLLWDKKKRALLLLTGDGGYSHDPFNLAQDLNFPHGKILAIVPSAISSRTDVPAVARLDQLPPEVRKGIEIISRGVRNSHGLHIQPANEGQIYYLTHNGLLSNEALFRYNPEEAAIYNDFAATNPVQKIINLGWSGWDNGQPTTTQGSCREIERKKDKLLLEPPTVGDLRTVAPSTILISWNTNSDFGRIYRINNGDSLRFLSTDGIRNDVYSATISSITAEANLRIINGEYLNQGAARWIAKRQLRQLGENLDFTYQPMVSNDRVQRLYFTSSANSNLMRLIVEVLPVEAGVLSLVQDMALIQNGSPPFITEPQSRSDKINLVTYIRRILINKLLPYFRYPTLRPTGSTVDSLLGSRITGVTLFNGNRDTTFGQGLVISDWNRKLHDQLSANKGLLFWVNLDPTGQIRSQRIEVLPELLAEDGILTDIVNSANINPSSNITRPSNGRSSANDISSPDDDHLSTDTDDNYGTDDSYSTSSNYNTDSDYNTDNGYISNNSSILNGDHDCPRSPRSSNEVPLRKKSKDKCTKDLRQMRRRERDGYRSERGGLNSTVRETADINKDGYSANSRRFRSDISLISKRSASYPSSNKQRSFNLRRGGSDTRRTNRGDRDKTSPTNQLSSAGMGGRAMYYVTIGGNQSNDRLYLGTYRSPYGGILNKGGIYEVVPVRR